MLEDLAKNISDLIENLETLNEEIINDSSKEDLIYELESIIKNIENYLNDDD